MVSRQIVRPSQQDDVKPHTHHTTQITGVWGFLRALKGVINGSLRVDSGGSISVGGDVPPGAVSQFFVHNSQSHVVLLETDDGDYPDIQAVLDVQDGVIRLIWDDGSSPYAPLALFGPTHASATGDIELRDSNNSAVLRWNDQGGSGGFWELIGDLFQTGNFRGSSFRVFPGPDTDDFWLFTPADSGDSVVIQQWDQSGATTVDRIRIGGTGGASDGEITVHDSGGSEVARFTGDGISTAARGTVGYAEVTSNQTGIGTSQTDLTNLSVTFTVQTGRRYKVTASLQLVRTGGTPAFALAQIKEGDGSPVYQEMIVETPSTAYSLTVQRSVILDEGTHLTAGSETIKLSAAAAAGASNEIALSALSTRPAFLLVEDIGPA